MVRSRTRVGHGHSVPPPPPAPPDRPWRPWRPGPLLPVPARAWDRAAFLLLAAWLLAMAWTSLAWHPTPFYSAESDVIGEYIPAARDLRAGRLAAGHYQSKGFGYPLLLAAAAVPTGGDYYLAARVLNVVSGAAGAVSVYALFKAFLGAEAGWFVLAGLVLNPVYIRDTVEVATDVPTFALLITATFLLLRKRTGRALLASGFLAGYAVITRYNCLFLPAAGAFVLLARGRRLRSLGAYSAGFVVPVAAWSVAARGMGGSALGSANVMNMAYEIYGRGLYSESFWSTRGSQFHSFWDVVRHEPAVFASRIGYNLATRWLRDARELLPVWLGALALPGIGLGWWRRPGAAGMALHLALCYLALAPVFYLERFGLYLIPFYVSGAVALILYARLPWRRAPEQRAGRPSRLWTRMPRLVLLSALILASGWRALVGLRDALANAPHEAREAGLLLRSMARPGDRIMARKPNVAYFADLTYVPLPDANVVTYAGLIEAARKDAVRYLLFSPMEDNTRPQFLALADSGAGLPGLRQVAFRTLDPGRYYALYEFTGESCLPESLQVAILAMIRRTVGRHPESAPVHTHLAGQLLSLRRDREAVEELRIAQRLNPRDGMTAKMQVYAYERLGDYEAVAEACERGIRLGSTTGWERSILGWMRVEQGRFAEGIGLMKEALLREPGNADYTFGLGFAYLSSGDARAAVQEFAKVLNLDPDNGPARLYAARSWWRLGEPRRALELLETPGSASGPLAAELKALTDSIRTSPRGSR
jgi:tetratricopeptide (TPR) repeat protein